MDWLLRWHDIYVKLYGEQPRLWALGVHCYLPAAKCQQWVDANVALAKRWTESGRIWLTEWAMCRRRVGTEEQALTEAEKFQSWLLANPNVERAAWYLTRDDKDQWCQTALITPMGSLSRFGEWYVASPAVCSSGILRGCGSSK